jgi:hypothetical protein
MGSLFDKKLECKRENEILRKVIIKGDWLSDKDNEILMEFSPKFNRFTRRLFSLKSNNEYKCYIIINGKTLFHF